MAAKGRANQGHQRPQEGRENHRCGATAGAALYFCAETGSGADMRDHRLFVALCVATAVALAPSAAFARCTQTGNTTFCVYDDGSIRTTTRAGNTTIVNESDGYHKATTEAGSGTTMIDNAGNATQQYRMGNHTFETGTNGAGDSWSRSTTMGGNDTFSSGQINGQPWNQTTQSMGQTTVWSGVNTEGTAWSETRQVLGSQSIMTGTDPYGIAWPPQQQAQLVPVGGSGMTVFRDAGIYVPPAPIQTFCLIC
jgi:hypothetical protein